MAASQRVSWLRTDAAADCDAAAAPGDASNNAAKIQMFFIITSLEPDDSIASDEAQDRHPSYSNPMPIYVALLRGIMPMNPNMKGERLRKVFESLGFENVATVIASGNVIFSARSQNAAALEAKIEKALPKQLGFKSTTMLRSRHELERLVKKNPL